MNLKKAIELLTIMLKVCNTLFPQDEKDAIKLLIEAGKHIEQERSLHTYPSYKLLPGETKD